MAFLMSEPSKFLNQFPPIKTFKIQNFIQRNSDWKVHFTIYQQ